MFLSGDCFVVGVILLLSYFLWKFHEEISRELIKNQEARKLKESINVIIQNNAVLLSQRENLKDWSITLKEYFQDADNKGISPLTVRKFFLRYLIEAALSLQENLHCKKIISFEACELGDDSWFALKFSSKIKGTVCQTA